jgi:hypothetical protein
MPSRKPSRTIALALLLTAGTVASAPAQSARRSDPHPALLAREAKAASPGLLASVLSLWGLVHFAHHGPPPTGGGDGDGHSTGEGTGICPHGHM